MSKLAARFAAGTGELADLVREDQDLSTKAESKKTLLKLWSRGNTLFVVVDETGSDKDSE